MTRRERASAVAIGWLEVMSESICDVESAVEVIVRQPRLDPAVRERADEALLYARETRELLGELDGELREFDAAMQMIQMLAVTGKRTDHVRRRARELNVRLDPCAISATSMTTGAAVAAESTAAAD